MKQKSNKIQQDTATIRQCQAATIEILGGDDSLLNFWSRLDNDSLDVEGEARAGSASLTSDPEVGWTEKKNAKIVYSPFKSFR